MYISQDPIGLAGNNPNFYGYTFNANSQVDVFGLDCLPKGKKIKRTVYRFSPPDRVSTTWDAHKWNVASNHRYTKSGVGGVYGANSPKTAMAEVGHYGIDPNSVELVSKKVQLNNVLDLTDSKVRDQLGVKLTDLNGNDYAKTHELGDWALSNGYDGILAPSARNLTGSNLISFGGF
jgi:RES domain-containing protein